MKLLRRTFLRLITAAAALPVVSRLAEAQAYPTRPVRIIAGFPAGSTTDVVARLFGQWLQDRLGQPFIVENRPGAGGNIAAEVVANAPPDGYTLLPLGSSLSINATLHDNLKFDITRDFAPIAAIAFVPNVLLVNPSVEARTVPEFIAYARANPGKLNMASAGIGSSSHLAGELFQMMTGIKLLHVPYRGQPPALTDLLGGQVQVSFATTPASIEHIRAGKLRALAVTTAKRWETLPDLPAIAEFAPGYEATTWTGFTAPTKTSREIVERLNREINAAIADTKIKAGIADFGGTPLGGSPADFGKLIADETEKWAKVIRTANIKAK